VPRPLARWSATTTLHELLHSRSRQPERIGNRLVRAGDGINLSHGLVPVAGQPHDQLLSKDKSFGDPVEPSSRAARVIAGHSVVSEIERPTKFLSRLHTPTIQKKEGIVKEKSIKINPRPYEKGSATR